MGNKESSAAKGEGSRKKRKQNPRLYHYVDMYGGGELIPWMKYARETGDSSIIDAFIETKVIRNLPLLFLLKNKIEQTGSSIFPSSEKD